RMLGDIGACAVGVDYDGEALRSVRGIEPRARLVNADALRLPLGNASFDVVVSFETIEHVPDAARLVAEIRRVLKPGGRLVLSTPTGAFGPPGHHPGNPFHIREFTADELRDLLQTSFTTVELFGQRPAASYRFVPYLMFESHIEPRELAWKLMTRLPF